MFRRYTSEQLDEMEERGELFVCPHCDYHGHSDDFGEQCPVCHVDLTETEECSKDVQ